MSNKFTILKKVLVIVLSFSFLNGIAPAFDKQDFPRFGISATLQNEQLQISIPIWTQWQFTVNPSIYFIHVSDSFTDAGLGIQFNYVLQKGRAVPYIGVASTWYFYSPG